MKGKYAGKIFTAFFGDNLLFGKCYVFLKFINNMVFQVCVVIIILFLQSLLKALLRRAFNIPFIYPVFLNLILISFYIHMNIRHGVVVVAFYLTGT